MKKSFDFARVFFIGVLAIGLFGLLGFVIASSHPNPGHGGSEICDSFFCVVNSSGQINTKVGIGTSGPNAILSIATTFYTNSDDIIQLVGSGSGNGKADLFFTREAWGNAAGSWVIRTDKDLEKPLKIGTTQSGSPPKRLDLELSNDLIFADGTRQNSAAPGSCMTYINQKIGGSDAPQSVEVTCPTDKTLTGGGCKRTPWSTGSSYPSVSNTWIHDSWTCAGGSPWTNLTVYAICC